MLDRLLSAHVERGAYQSDPNYTADQAVTGMQLYNPDAEKLAVIFPPWHGGSEVVDRLKERLVRHAHAVAAYSLHDQIIEPDAERVIASFSYLRDRITEDLHDKTSGDRYREVHFIGISLGNVALGVVAREFKAFNSATMVVAGSSLALGVWDSTRTQAIRRDFEKEGIRRSDLDEAWLGIAPKTQAEAFSGKPVRMIVSTTDRIIPSEQQCELVDAVEAHRAHTTVQQTRLGHYATVVRYCLLDER